MRPRHPASIPLHHSGRESHLLREIVRTHQALMAGFSRAIGISGSRFALMRLLANTEGEVGVMDLARQLGINPAAVTRQVREMEAEGLVVRRADTKDGRRSWLRLSSEGGRAFAAIHARSHDLERALVAELGADRMREAADVLARLRGFVETALARPGGR